VSEFKKEAHSFIYSLAGAKPINRYRNWSISIFSTVFHSYRLHIYRSVLFPVLLTMHRSYQSELKVATKITVFKRKLKSYRFRSASIQYSVIFCVFNVTM